MNITIEELLLSISGNQEFITSPSNIDKKCNTVISIPLISEIHSTNYLTEDNIERMIDIDEELARTGDFFAYKIKDDSMLPILVEDDIIVVKEQTTFENGDIVVAIINEEVAIRKWKKTDNTILIQPFNNSYEPLIFSKEELETKHILIIGIVKQLKREF